MELRGKRQICEHTNRAWSTLLMLIERDGFPMAKVGGTWVSDTDEIKIWTKRKLQRRG